MFYLGPWVLTQLALGMGKAVGSRSTSISSTCCGCIKVKVLVAQLCLTFCDPMNCSPPGSSVHGILASILQCSAFFMVQLLHPYITTGKAIVLTRRTFVNKVMSLLYNMFSRLAIAFLPRNKHILYLRLQSSSAVILEPKKIKSLAVPLFPHLFAMK